MDHVFLMSVLTGFSVLGVLLFALKDCFSKISIFPKLKLIEPITVLNPLGKLKAI
jgi:hypothetical protein